MFDRFGRVEATTAGKQGTGLGLWIVEALVEAHDGRVKATSPYHHWYVYDPAYADGQLLNPQDPTSARSQSLYKTRNVVIDLAGGAGSGQVSTFYKASVSYTLAPL